MTVYAHSVQDFEALLRVSRSSVATPPWFASPVDAREDETSITVTFHVPVKNHGRVRVQASDTGVVLSDRTRATRVCALACAVQATGIETTRAGDLLRVRMPKKRPDGEAYHTPASR